MLFSVLQKTLLKTSLGPGGVQGEAEAEVVDHSSLPLVDSLLLEVVFLRLTQVSITTFHKECNFGSQRIPI